MLAKRRWIVLWRIGVCLCLPVRLKALSTEGRGSIFVVMWLLNNVEDELSESQIFRVYRNGCFYTVYLY